MNFTTKSRYAVNALTDLEYLSDETHPVALSAKLLAVAEETGDVDALYFCDA